MAQAQSPTDKLGLEIPGASSAKSQCWNIRGLASICLKQDEANRTPEVNHKVMAGSLQAGGDPSCPWVGPAVSLGGQLQIQSFWQEPGGIWDHPRTASR